MNKEADSSIDIDSDEKRSLEGFAINNTDDKQWDTQSARQDPSFWNELHTNKETRYKLFQSIFVALSAIVTGWSKGQVGPAFLDILQISGTDIEKGSDIVTAYYTGYLLGSIIAGAVYSRINKYLVFAISLVMYSIAVAIIPWCTVYELMIFFHLLYGCAGGSLSVCTMCEMVNIWGSTDRGRSYTQAVYAIYATSSILSPLATAPFLRNVEETSDWHSVYWNSSYLNTSVVNFTQQNFNSVNDKTLTSNTTEVYVNLKKPNQEQSRLYIAYSITAGIGLVSALPFLMLVYGTRHKTGQSSATVKFRYVGTLPLLVKRLQFVNIMVYIMIQNAIDYTFAGYLATFCVQYFSWTKSSGALVTSVVFFAQLIGRFSGGFLIRLLQSHQIMIITSVCYTAGFMLFLICAHLYLEPGIWVSVCVIGIPFSIGWPTFVSWTNENYIPVLGEMSGFMNTLAFLGALLAPMLFGYLMEELSLLWFSYLCVGKSFVTLLTMPGIIICLLQNFTTI